MSAREDQLEAAEWARRVASTVQCPHCRASTGALCRNLVGRPLDDPHPSRVAAGVKAARRER